MVTMWIALYSVAVSLIWCCAAKQVSLVTTPLGFIKSCDEFDCSDIVDNVCGSTLNQDGTVNLVTYHNICYLRKKQCELSGAIIIEVPHHHCNIISDLPTDPKYRRSETTEEGVTYMPRVPDFSIVGAHQVCNHTCPIYCIDWYEPVCAQIWKRGSDSIFTRRAMVNHCHVDLFSCSTGLNVTISPLYQCYKNPSGLMFMKHMAALKSLKLLDTRRSNEDKHKSKLWPLLEFIRRSLHDIGKRFMYSNNTMIEKEQETNETTEAPSIPPQSGATTTSTAISNSVTKSLLHNASAPKLIKIITRLA